VTDWTDTFFTGFWSAFQRAPALVEAAPAEARFLRRALRLRRGSRVADIPCGDGRIALELARAGCDVLGVDGCRESLRRARRRFRVAGLDGRFGIGDLRDLHVDGQFDAVINWGGSFGYFDQRTNAELLARLGGLLVPGGRLAVDNANRERILRQFMPRISQEAEGVRVVCRNVWDPDGERIEGRWTFTLGDRRERKRSSMRLYTPGQMRRLMEGVGLVVENVYGGGDGSEYSRGSRRMIMVGRRPK
jgi:SAM-dependent methyltransferase